MTEPNIHSSKIPYEALDTAMEWQVTLWSGEITAQEQAAFDRWLLTDPTHSLAWQQVQQVNRQLGDIPGQLGGQVLRQTEVIDKGRRRLLLSAGLMSSLGLLGFGVSRTPQWHIATADYRTTRGEINSLTLPDGTRVTLNTASAIDVQFNADTRRLTLHRGEILVVTGSDTGFPGVTPRPFWVETSAGAVRPIGTQFTVQQLDHRIQVQVMEGAVELLPAQGQGIRLDAGQQALFNQQGTFAVQAVDAINTAWTRGLLIAEQQKLGEFIGNLGRYHTGVLRCDPAVADLAVSGVYPLKDTHAILKALEQALPVRVSSVLGYWTTISSR